ncbi:MAG: UDP-glucose/GDP-mannose dehydrogenase family protein [Acidimicrobiaceae bacterium]|nr:UDP-glucose/GDP-mannose dehydrogenase family protein [Acidimicrobiaceae bacterium]
MKVAVFGLGYVGTVTAAVLASNGHQVWGVDVDPSKVATVKEGRSTVVEPGLDHIIASAVASGNLRATTDPAPAVDGAGVSLICVGTPSSSTGSADVRHVLRVAGDIAAALTTVSNAPGQRHAVVVRSTIPPGTIDDQVAPLIAGRIAGSPVAIGVGMCPEFLREGSAIADFYDAPLTVVGTAEDHVAAAVEELFGFLESPIQVVATREAEALKYACNAFHAVKVSFANELGRLFRALDVDARAVMELFCQDTKLNISRSYLKPGFAFGGSCLPKDLRSLLHLARMSSIDLPLLAGTVSTNTLSVNDVVNRVVASDARAVALLGLSFKMGSDDLRESPYVELAETLLGKGFDVRIYDPVVDTCRLIGANRQYAASRLPHLQRLITPTPAAALQGADLALVSSSHPAVLAAVLAEPPSMVLDLHGRLGGDIEALPQYEGVAW